MEEESEYKKLPTDEKCVHKLWKARVAGYEEAGKLFKQLVDEKSPEWNKYLGLIKKFVADSNAVAQEKGLEAALAFVENCGHAGKTAGEVMSNIVAKCIAAPKTKTKDLALQITLMYVEIEKQETVQEELLKGMDHKNPRIVAACVNAMTTALKQFGNKVISIKLLVKKISPLLTDRDKDVRTEGKALVVEMQKWIGAALEPHISQLQPVVLQELRDAFSETGQKVTPERYIRSQQAVVKTSGQNEDRENDDNEDEADGDGGVQDVDPYELLDPVDILSKLPKDFYEKLEAKKWQERKEALDSLEALLKAAPKLEQGDYGDLVRAMKRVISKDTNVILVAIAGRCVTMMASGLKKKFQTYTTALIPCALDKFKEKKPNVVSALREAVDAMYPCTNIEAIAEDVIEALNNKNPSVKAETASFLSRAFANTQPAALSKKLLKLYVAALLQALESADPIVRDQAAEALGTATKLVGEKNISPFIGQLDSLKEQKIKECCEKAVILVKVSSPKREARPKTAPVAKSEAPKAGSTQPKPVKRPTTAGAKKPVAKKPGTGSAKSGGLAKSTSAKEVTEREMSPEEVDMKAEEILDPSILNGLIDSNWKTRLEAVQTFAKIILDFNSDVSSQVLLKILNKKPGLKDTNFQVLKMRLETVKLVAEKFSVSITCVDCVLFDIVEKLSDAKCSQAAAEALTALSEATTLDYVACGSLEYALDKQKSPRVQTEIFAWLSNALREFGMVINSKSVLFHVKKALAATNPAVRSAGVGFLGTLHLYMGNNLMPFIDGEKPAVKQQILQELEKNDEEAPVPTRGMSKSASKGSIGDEIEYNNDDDMGAEEDSAPIQEVRSRVDISPQITEALIQEINDKNWKVRNEALEKVKNIITDAQQIKPSIGDLPQALVPRLVDSNSKIAQLALQICETIVSAIGPKAKTHIRTLFPGIVQGLGDTKTWIRSASLQCINVLTTECGVSSVFEGEMVHDALKSGSPILKAELWAWLAEKVPNAPLKSIPREELSVCVPLLYAALEDRGAEVRKGANDAVYAFMLHLGPESMSRQAEKLKPGSKSVVQSALEKARSNLPIQPLPKTEAKTVKSGGAQKAQGNQQKPGQGKPAKGLVKSSSTTSAKGKKDDDADSLAPLLPLNNTKNQRIIDDQKLKVLKWNFVTPREEFTDLLRDQMTVAGVNKILMANMFHADFRYHIKSIDSLLEDLPENGQALIANLDLIFKWLTLRFFDTNPSVLLRGLEYLTAVFQYLINEEYHMAEYEASCFIPYLVLKVGDPKDTVRNGVKGLLKQICIVYSGNKLFGYLMEGLKSKNARQRTECLDVLGLLIESYGISICNPSPASALKEIARQISDRDNSVRNAALNCVVQAYFLEGEKVYKMIGQISDKDHSLLEERIKRAAKGRETMTRRTMLIPPNPTSRPMSQDVSKEVKIPVVDTNANPNEYEEEEEESQNEYLPPPMSDVSQAKKYNNLLLEKKSCVKKLTPDSLKHLRERLMKCQGIGNVNGDDDLNSTFTKGLPVDSPKQSPDRLALRPGIMHQYGKREQPRPISGPFGLNPEIVAEIEKGMQEDIKIITKQPVLQEMDLSFLDEPVSVPAVPVARILPTTLTLSSPPSRLPSSVLPQSSPSLSQAPAARYEIDHVLMKTIQSIANPNLPVAMTALSQMDGILKSSRVTMINRFEESLLLAIVEQLQNLQQRSNQAPDQLDILNGYRFIMAVLTLFYEIKQAGQTVSSQTVGALVDQLLRLLVHKALDKGCSDSDDKLIRAVNNVCVKVLERSDHTAVLIALINLLDKSIAGESPSPRYQELEMKCLWKVMKMIPIWEGLDYDKLLYRLHLFFKSYPSTYWRKNSQMNDTPFRTIKTVVHTLLKKKGHSIMNHLTQIPDLNESELHSYLVRLFKTSKLEEHKKENLGDPQGQAKMPRLVQEELSQILKRIGGKEHTKEALNQLYDLRERHPDVDIWACMKDTSTLFRDYIDRGLREVEDERHRSGRVNIPQPIVMPTLPLSSMTLGNIQGDVDSQGSKSHSYYSERLKALQAQIGIGGSGSNSQPRTPMIDNRSIADAANDNGRNNIDPKYDLPNLHPVGGRTEPQMDALRQKLQQIKSANR